MALPLTKTADSRAYDVDATPMTPGTCTCLDGIPPGSRAVRALLLRERGVCKGVGDCLVREGTTVSSDHGRKTPTTPTSCRSPPPLLGEAGVAAPSRGWAGCADRVQKAKADTHAVPRRRRQRPADRRWESRAGCGRLRRGWTTSRRRSKTLWWSTSGMMRTARAWAASSLAIRCPSTGVRLAAARRLPAAGRGPSAPRASNNHPCPALVCRRACRLCDPCCRRPGVGRGGRS